MKELRVLFRVDSGHKLGTGHLNQCLWFAKKTRINGLFCIKAHQKSEELIKYYGFPAVIISRQENFREKECAKISMAIREFEPEVIIFDMPNLSNAYLGKIHIGAAKVVAFSAIKWPVRADLHFATVFTPLEANKQFFGPKYFLLREDFVGEKSVAVSSRVRNILILFGGGDPGNFTLKTLQALARIGDEVCVSIVLGGAFIFSGEIQAFLRNFNKPHRIFFDLKDARELIAIMKNSDLAIVSGGYTLCELMHLGVPCIVLSQNSIEEKKIYPNFPEGNFVDLGRGEKISVKNLGESVENVMRDFRKRKTMSATGRVFIDGRGIDRVFKIVKHLCRN